MADAILQTNNRVRVMRKIIRNGVMVCFVMIPLLLAILFFKNSERERLLEERQNCRSFYLSLQYEGKEERITAWKDEQGMYYMVLPSYVLNCDDLAFHGNTQYDRRVLLDGKEIDSFTNLQLEQLQDVYQLAFCNMRGKVLESTQLYLMTAECLPAVFITTTSGNMDTIHASKENKEKGTISIYSKEGGCDYAGQLNHIKGRGNVTWAEKKKPYNVSLEEPISILGMDTTSEWVLLAGAKDASHIRNKLAFDMAKEIGLERTSDSAYVDLYLNGEYTGLYLLTEKVEGDTTGDLGSEYLLELEMQERLAAEEYTFQTRKGQGIVVKSSQKVSEEEMAAIEQQLQAVEDAIYQTDWKRLKELMDLDSFVKIYVTEEILQNHDAYISSQYMTLSKEQGKFKKLYSGPVWDFDSCLVPKDGMYANSLSAGQSREGYPKFWIEQLIRESTFQEMVRETYQEVSEVYLKQKIWESIEKWQEEISTAVELDCLRWHNQTKDGWQEEMDRLKRYLAQRLLFLSEFWGEQETFHEILLQVDSDTFSSFTYYVKDGGYCLEFPRGLNKKGHRFTGWYLVGTDTEFSEETAVFADLSVEARWEQEGTGNVLGRIRDAGLLQMRYLLFGTIVLAVFSLLLWDRRKNK